MIIYSIIFLIPSYYALTHGENTKKNTLTWIFFGFSLIIIIGFRDEVGADWNAYLRHYKVAKEANFFEVLILLSDLGHSILIWLMAKLNLKIYGLNFIYAIIFVVGLFKFCKYQPYPWLSLTVAIPYLTIVVAMSLSKQASAIGLVLLAISFLMKKNYKAYIAFIILASLFHYSAIVMLFFLSFLINKKYILSFLFITSIFFLFYFFFIKSDIQDLLLTYITFNLKSSGAIFRISLNLFAAIILIYFSKKWKEKFNDFNFWFLFSLASIFAFIFQNFAETAIDRLSIYLIPLQLVVFSRLPIFFKNNQVKKIVRFFIIIFYFFVLIIWVNFANHSKSWFPYKNIILESVY